MAEQKNPEARGDAKAKAPAVDLDDESLDQASGGAATPTTTKYEPVNETKFEPVNETKSTSR